MMRRVLAIALLLPFLADAQYPYSRTYEVRTGQRRPHITTLIQDAQGLLWAGSDLGIYRTDGERTDQVLATEGATVDALGQGATGILAALSTGVLLRCSGYHCDTLWASDQLAGTSVRVLREEEDGGLWIGTYGAGLWHLRNGRMDRFGVQNGLLDDHINALCSYQDGVLVATDQGVAMCSMDEGVQFTITEVEGLPDNLVMALACDTIGRVWGGTERAGVFQLELDGAAPKVHLLDSAWRHGPVTALVADDGLVWTGTSRSGVVVHDTRVGLGAYLPQDAAQGAGTRVYDLLLAADGAVWSTDGSERVRRADPRVLHVPSHEGVDLTRITALCGDREGRIWFATPEGVFNHRAAFADDLTLTRTTITVDETTPVVSLAVDTHGQLWAATFGAGLLRLGRDGALVRMDEQGAGINDNVLSVRERNGQVWMATLDGLYVCRDPGQASPGLEHVTLPGTGFVYDVLPMPDGSVLAATDGSGVVHRSPAGGTTDLQAPADSRTYYSLALDREGTAWACGPGSGICQVDGMSLTCSAQDRAPFDGSVYSVVPYADRILVLGQSGLAAWSPENGGRLVDLGDETGLRDLTAELNTACTDAHGALWLATSKGLVRITLDGADLSGEVPTAITAMFWAGEELPMVPDTRLRHDQDFLTFRFAGRHHAAPENVRFHYQLVGYDEAPKITRDREVGYSRLPPGDYTFRVKASVGDNLPTDRWTEHHFIIQSPWWRRPWAIGLFVLLLTGVLYAFVRVREDRLRMRDRIEKEQARFQLEALRSQVNPHFLFNSFNTLIELIEEEPDKAVEHVEDLSDLFRNILTVRDKELITLDEELDLVDTYFKLEQRRFGERIRLVTDVVEEARSLQLPPLTLQLLVENAIKHNTATDDEPLVVRVKAGNGVLEVRNADRPRSGPARSTGYGLDSIRQRYTALSERPVEVVREGGEFIVRIPLIERRP